MLSLGGMSHTRRVKKHMRRSRFDWKLILLILYLGASMAEPEKWVVNRMWWNFYVGSVLLSCCCGASQSGKGHQPNFKLWIFFFSLTLNCCFDWFLPCEMRQRNNVKAARLHMHSKATWKKAFITNLSGRWAPHASLLLSITTNTIFGVCYLDAGDEPKALCERKKRRPF